MTSPYWPLVKARQFDDVPDTYLDWLRDQPFISMDTLQAINRELATRKRSDYHVPDKFGKVLDA